MEASGQLTGLRSAGCALLAIGILFMIGAAAAAYFRRFPLPSDPLDQLTLIADDRIGWTAQAIIFPICFLAVVLIFGWMAARLPAGLPRWLAIAATVASAAALLLGHARLAALHELRHPGGDGDRVDPVGLNPELPTFPKSWQLCAPTNDLQMMGCYNCGCKASPRAQFIIEGDRYV